MSYRARFFLPGILIFTSFIVFSYLVAKELFTYFDFDTTVRLQNNIPRRFDDAFSLLSDIGSFEILTVLLLIFLVAWRRIRGILLLFSYIGFHLIELYGKFFVAHPPPPEFMLRTTHILEFPQFYVRAENSYPSGHAGRTTFLTTVLIMLVLTNKALSLPVKIALVGLLLAFDVAMLLSRVYLGEHWISDVVGGLLLGAGLAVMSYALAK